ncbi:hypothetical protein [Salinispora arenicola]|uniref:hypothetical protein n=1 Tax=Salinispora arenicola TaxID=168697 RepID=UPI00037643D7|nr:hypothetical protein [Salinispora arenicola]
MPADRARKVRQFARALEEQFGGQFDADYDTGPKWRLDWVNGPSEPAVRTLADAADLAGADLRFYRRYSRKAIAVTAIRMKTAGRLERFDGGRYPQEIVEWEALDIDHPDRGTDALQDAMAELLIAAATATARTARAEWEAARPRRWTPGDGRPTPLDATETAVDLVRTRGVGWLVEQAITDGATVAPLVVLSARYATHADAGAAVAWAHRAQPLPLNTAVDLALADDELPAAAGAALLALLPDLRAEWDRTEAAITAAARRAGLPEPAPR